MDELTKIKRMFIIFSLFSLIMFSSFAYINSVKTDQRQQIYKDGEEIFEFCKERGCFLSKVQLEYILSKYYDKNEVFEVIKDAPYSSWGE